MAGLAAVSQESKALCIPWGTRKYYIYPVVLCHLKLETSIEYLNSLIFNKTKPDPKPIFLETLSIVNCVFVVGVCGFVGVLLFWVFFLRGSKAIAFFSYFTFFM